MNVVKCAAPGLLAAVVLLAGASLSSAADSFTGRWAADVSACSSFGFSAASSPLIVSETAVRWHDDACRIARMYKTGDTIHIQALCWSLAGERSIPVSLRARGGRLAVVWNCGAPSQLQRCP